MNQHVDATHAEAGGPGGATPGGRPPRPLLRAAARYGLAAAAVVFTLALRLALERAVGGSLPAFITFYPAVILVALFLGLGPGMLATVLVLLSASWWVLPPAGFAIDAPADRLALVFFAVSGALICTVAHLYRRSRDRLLAAERELAQRESAAALRAVAAREQFLAGIVENASQPFAVGYPDGRLGLFNRAYEQLTGYTAGELRAIDWHAQLTPPEWRAPERQRLAEQAGHGRPVRYEKEYLRKDGVRLPIELLVHLVRDAAGRPEYYYSFVTDISARKQAEREHATVVRFLNLINAAKDTRALIEAAVEFFRAESGCETVGIRLRVGDDYPYFETRGFPAEFVRLENSLCARDADGQPCRDGGGNPVLDCMCGNVLCGRFDPAKPFFTAQGSFWSNGTTELLAGTPEADRQTRMRNRCNGEGYESVALIALRAGSERLGLLQLNDRRRDRFTPGAIAFWERLVGYLAVAVAKARLDEALRASEERYRALFENMAEGFFLAEMVADADGKPCDFRFLDVNPAYERIMGLTRAQAVGKTAGALFPGLERRWIEAVARVAETGERSCVEGYVAANGRHYANSYFSPCRGQFASVFTDISERKQAEEALRRQAELIRLSHDAIVLWRMEDGIEIWNRGAEELYGFTAAEALGRSPHELLHTAFPVPWARIAEALRVRGHWDGELHHRTKGGREISVSARKLLLRGDDGVERVMETNRDITHLKEAQRQSEALNAALEQRVRERTAELESSNRELEAFCYSVSHDLRAPLRSIDGFSLALIEDFGAQLPDEGRNFLKQVRDSCQQMGRLIDDLLNLSRLNRVEMRRERVDLGALAAEIVGGLRRQSPGRAVEVRIAPELVADGDARLLRAALFNLLDNAWKFTSRTPDARIEVGALPHSNPPASSVPVFFVRDNGAGFDMRYAGKLFGAFQRLHSMHEFPGTGVGLAIVQRVLHRHGGRIWAEGAVGCGATFYFTLSAKGTSHESGK